METMRVVSVLDGDDSIGRSWLAIEADKRGHTLASLLVDRIKPIRRPLVSPAIPGDSTIHKAMP